MTPPRLFAVLVTAALALPVQADLIRIGGTGSGLGTLQLIGQAFEKVNPQHRIEALPALGSTGGIKALRVGQLQVAVANREPNAEERAARLVAKRYASTPLALVTHAGVPAMALTRDRLAQLLSGREQRWPGGQAVRLVLRPPNDGDSRLLAGLSPTVANALEAAQKRPGMVMAQTDSEAADYIERTPNAFGAVAVSQVQSEQRKLSILSLDGVPATPAALEVGRYPMAKEMVLITRADASEAVRAFAAFVTQSPEAAAILRRTGHVSR
jgi:phosphate transport system substrate-binding protein